jgi:hypothetical protein
MIQLIRDRWLALQVEQRAALAIAFALVIALLYVTRRVYLR